MRHGLFKFALDNLKDEDPPSLLNSVSMICVGAILPQLDSATVESIYKLGYPKIFVKRLRSTDSQERATAASAMVGICGDEKRAYQMWTSQGKDMVENLLWLLETTIPYVFCLVLR
jgi:hypothetical protein